MADDPLRWLRRGVVGAVIVVGWLFIAWQNKFHVTASVAFVCLGFLAVVLTIYNLWQTGAAAVAPELGNSEAWTRPLGARGELEKEKRSLLKAIKEAEFDHEMGKLSKADADAMIATYRARAIAVLKELERFEDVSHAVDPSGRILEKETVRDQIAREVKARLELAGAKKSKKKPDKGEKKAEAKAEKAEAGAEKAETKASAEKAKVEKAEAEAVAAKVETEAEKSEAKTEKSEAKTEKSETKAEGAEAKTDEPAAVAAVEPAEGTTDSSGATEATS